jgi:small subunit ribosomal protein S18
MGKGGRGKRRRKVSYLTLNKIETVGYKDVGLLRRFINEQGKILSARQTGNTAGQQRMVTRAIRRAREMALLPFVSLEIASAERPYRDRGEGRPIRRDRPRPESAPPRPEENAPAAPAEPPTEA